VRRESSLCDGAECHWMMLALTITLCSSCFPRASLCGASRPCVTAKGQEEENAGADVLADGMDPAENRPDASALVKPHVRHYSLDNVCIVFDLEKSVTFS